MPSSSGRIAALLSTVMQEAADHCSISATKVFDLHAIHSVLCRVYVDLTQEPLDFVAKATKHSRVEKRIRGGALMTMFGALAEEGSWESVPDPRHAKEVCFLTFSGLAMVDLSLIHI